MRFFMSVLIGIVTCFGYHLDLGSVRDDDLVLNLLEEPFIFLGTTVGS